MNDLTPDLLRRYDRPGPRYTSYPTAADFSEAVDADAYEARLRGLDADDPIGVYVHFPFCEKQCHYCACHVIQNPHRKRKDEYLSLLDAEIERTRASIGRAPRVSEIHFGGGTPTFYSGEELAEVVHRIGSAFELDPGCVGSVEVDPRVTTPEQLRALHDVGFRRISFGVQDFEDGVQELIGRYQSIDETRSLVEQARDMGYASVNFDLVYGLPGQTPESLARTLDAVLAMRPDRLAVYGFAYVPWMASNQKRIDESTIPGRDTRWELLTQVRSAFIDAGYVAIGMDHFALPDDALAEAFSAGQLGRTFMGYTEGRVRNVLGFGVSSIGFVDGLYVQNEKKLSRYGRRVMDGELPVLRGIERSPDDAVRAEVIEQLMCNLRLDKDRIESRFGISFDEYFSRDLDRAADLVDDGLVRVTDRAVEAVGPGRALVRNLAMCFDQRLADRATRGRFSRTV